nr:hypothetical protein [Tanacetum cinerariifolium]
MAFRDFLSVKTDEDLSFLPKEPSSDFGTGSPSVSINTEPPTKVAEPTGQLVENTTDSGDSSRQEKLVIHSRSVAARIRDQKYRTRGSSKPHVKRRLVQAGLFDVLELQNAYACHLKIFAITPSAWRGHLDNQLDPELLDLYDRYYAREKARDKECEELKAKCEAAMVDFDKKSSVKVLHGKIAALLVEAKKAKLEATEASLRQEVEIVKLDRAEVVLKVVPYVAMELVQSDYMVSSSNEDPCSSSSAPSQNAIPSSASVFQPLSPPLQVTLVVVVLVSKPQSPPQLVEGHRVGGDLAIVQTILPTFVVGCEYYPSGTFNHMCCPMRNKEKDSWDLGKRTWGGRESA